MLGGLCDYYLVSYFDLDLVHSVGFGPYVMSY